MRVWRVFLEGLALALSLFGGPLAALVLALAELARPAAFAAAAALLLVGSLQLRLSERRRRNTAMRRLRRQIGRERRVGRLIVALGVALAACALLLPPWIVVVLGLIGTTLLVARSLAIVGDSANMERDLEIGNLSPADEFPGIGTWARRVAALPGSWPARVGKTAHKVPPSGTIRGARLLVLAVVAGGTLAYAAVGFALVYQDERRPQRHGDGGPAATEAPADKGGPSPPTGSTFRPADPTYEDECPDLPDPLTIGHELGELFRADGAFKAGCGTEAQKVVETGAWYARGLCGPELRSLAVRGSDGARAILYGSAARFALDAARSGELVSVEGARPGGGDVYVVETLAGSYGFARQAAESAPGSTTVRSCSEITSTDRPFAEMFPPLLLHWRNLVEGRRAWVWPAPEDGSEHVVTFLAPGAEEVARGACDSEFSCYLTVNEVTWSANETAYVSLKELAPYIPPPTH